MPVNRKSPSVLLRGGAALKTWPLVEPERIESLVASLAWAQRLASVELAIALVAQASAAWASAVVVWVAGSTSSRFN